MINKYLANKKLHNKIPTAQILEPIRTHNYLLHCAHARAAPPNDDDDGLSVFVFRDGRTPDRRTGICARRHDDIGTQHVRAKRTRRAAFACRVATSLLRNTPHSVCVHSKSRRLCVVRAHINNINMRNASALRALERAPGSRSHSTRAMMLTLTIHALGCAHACERAVHEREAAAVSIQAINKYMYTARDWRVCVASRGHATCAGRQQKSNSDGGALRCDSSTHGCSPCCDEAHGGDCTWAKNIIIVFHRGRAVRLCTHMTVCVCAVYSARKHAARVSFHCASSVHEFKNIMHASRFV